MGEYEKLITEHQALQKQLTEEPDALDIERVLGLIERVRAAGTTISDPRQRQQLRAIPTYWGPHVYNETGQYPETQLAPYGATSSARGKSNLITIVVGLWDRLDPRARTALIVLCGLGIVALCIGLALATGASLMALLRPTPTIAPSATTATAVAEATVAPTAPGTLPPSETGTVLPTPTPTAVPTQAPAADATPSAAPPPESSPTPPPGPCPTPPPDSQGDVGTYADGASVDGVPAGVDISGASAAGDLRIVLQPTEGVPEPLVGWATDEEIFMWISLYEPVPDPPTVYTEWLFALDLDGDTGTGRPVDSARVNPDLGMEVAVVAYYDPAEGEYVPYYLVWDPNQGGWADGPGQVRFTVSQDRTLVGLAVPLETLSQTVAQITNVTVAPEAVKGRAAVVSQAAGQRVIDFYPDRPD
jgi:hypothetical protein